MKKLLFIVLFVTGCGGGGTTTVIKPPPEYCYVKGIQLEPASAVPCILGGSV